MQGLGKGFWFETEGKGLTLWGLVLGRKVWLWWLRQRWSEVRCGRGSEVVCGGKEGVLRGESLVWENNCALCERGKGAPKTPAFKRILGFRVICRFLEVEETSPQLCNLYFAF